MACHVGLLHCRHLKMVRTHLTGMVNATVVDSLDSSKRLTDDVWRGFHSGSDVSLSRWFRILSNVVWSLNPPLSLLLMRIIFLLNQSHGYVIFVQCKKKNIISDLF